jgi:hypothetical protein
MAKAKTFKTHTGLLLYQTQEEGEHVVSIVGDQQKELLRTPDRRAATKYFNGLKADYETRAKDEA